MKILLYIKKRTEQVGIFVHQFFAATEINIKLSTNEKYDDMAGNDQ